MPRTGRPRKAHWFREDEDFKDCQKCGHRRKASEFTLTRKAIDGRAGTCKPCRNAAKKASPSGQPAYRQATRRRSAEYDSHYNRFYKYGISREQFEGLVQQQQGRCGLCGSTPSKLCVDHDHSTGAVRGLLCSACNGALGKLGDTVEGLERAIDYLRREPSWLHPTSATRPARLT